MGAYSSKNSERTLNIKNPVILKNKDVFKEDDENDLKWNNTKPFIPPITTGEVIKVYDGDTITIATNLPLKNDETVYRFNIRLNGINCPEMRSKNREEKNAAIFIQQIVENLLLHKIVTLRNLASEKYNRLLADVILLENDNEINISQWLLNNNYAVKYDGGTKRIPVHWKEYMRTGKSRFKKKKE